MSMIYDFAAIGLGPFNLSLACLTDPINELNGIFIEQNSEFNWHPGLMLEDAHLQTPFMSDLVTLADPTHPLSFLNFIKQQGRLYSFYIRENFFLMRSEYNQYCQWATRQLSNIQFNRKVTQSHYNEELACYQLETTNTQTGEKTSLLAKKLVLGTGPSDFIPECCPDNDPRLSHASSYLDCKTEIEKNDSITIIGSGQTAAEIFYDLLQTIDQNNYELNWVTRSPRFFPLEYSKLTLEMTSPDWIDYFYALPQEQRDALNQQHKNLYKGINSDLINDIYDLLYVKRLSSSFRSNIHTNARLDSVRSQDDNSLSLNFFQQEQQQAFEINTQRVILATGYHYRLPTFLEGISQRLCWDDKGRFAVNRNYSIDHKKSEIFVQNAELHTHGFVTPDLGMACYRNSYIIRELLGRAYYPIEERIAFQQFAAPNNQQGGFIPSTTENSVDLEGLQP